MSLRWEKIDLNAGTINFEIDGRKRTKKRRGICPIVDELRPYLEEAKRRGTDIGPVFHINGRPIKSVRKAFENACRRAGITGVSRHTLKHTAITWACLSGKATLGSYRATSPRPEDDGTICPPPPRLPVQCQGRSGWQTLPGNFQIMRECF